MANTDLTAPEQEVVRRCLVAAVEGPFFPDWEFHALFGLERSEVAAVLGRWPDVANQDQTAQLAINNSMNNLLGYPHGMPGAFREWLGVPEDELRQIFSKWRCACGLGG
jgi:hypothetical protein